MKNFTRLYAEGGDIISKFYPSGPTGSSGTSMLEGLTGGPGDRKKKKGRCKGGTCVTKQPPGLGGRKKVTFNPRKRNRGFQ